MTKRTSRKRNPEIVETIELAKKNNLLELAKKLSSSKKNYKNINLDELNKIKESHIAVVGKVLGQGILEKKKTIAALGFSKQAQEKLLKMKCEIKTIKQEIKDSKLKGVKIIG